MLESAIQFDAYRTGGPAVGEPRVVWISSGDDPQEVSARMVAARRQFVMAQPHIVWNPVTGELVQMIQPDQKSRMYARCHPMASAISVLVVMPDDEPFTATECKGLEELMDYFRSLDVPDEWPMGPPHLNPVRRSTCSAGGHYSASQIDSSGHEGPGPISIERLFSVRTGTGTDPDRISGTGRWPSGVAVFGLGAG